MYADQRTCYYTLSSAFVQLVKGFERIPGRRFCCPLEQDIPTGPGAVVVLGPLGGPDLTWGTLPTGSMPLLPGQEAEARPLP
jgi:hypothetical protein